MNTVKKISLIWLIIFEIIYFTPIIQAKMLIVQNQEGHIGEEITITITVSNTANQVNAMGFDILFDPDVLLYTKYSPGPLTENYSYLNVSTIGNNRIRFGALESTPSKCIQINDNGEILSLNFFVISSVSSSTIQILSPKDDISQWDLQNGLFQTSDTIPSNSLYYKFKRLWPALKQPWYFYHPMDIAIDSQRFVYIADTWNDRIQKFTTTGQAVTKWGKNGNEDGMFQTPVNIDIYQDANQTYVYVVDQLNHRIQKFTGNGEFITKWGKLGSEKGQFMSPSGIAVDADGFIYVADTGNNRIQKFTSNGDFYQEWTSRNTYEKMLAPHSIAIDKNKNVYITDIEAHCVFNFSGNGQLESIWEYWEDNETIDHFYRPSGIAIATLDNIEIIIISDTANDRILTFLPNGKPLKEHESINAKLPSKYNSPAGLATDNGKIFIADSLNNRILNIQVRPEISVTEWASQGTQNGYFVRPSGICSIDEKIIVSSGTSYGPGIQSFIQFFSQTSVFLEKWTQSDNMGNAFNNPSGIAADDQYFYVVDSGNHRILQFNNNGKFIHFWGNKGSKPGEFESPKGVTLYQDLVIVADTGNHRIQIFDHNGNHINDWGHQGSLKGNLLIPKDVAADSYGNIYVADTGNHRIQKFDIWGNYIHEWGSLGSLSGEFNFPSGIDISNDQSVVIVADTGNNRCQVFSLDGTFLARFGEYGSGAGQFHGPENVSIDSDNNVYVTDRINNRIQKFQPISIIDGTSKAIIVVGDDTYGDALFQANANLAYRTLNYQGFGKNNIYYLSKDTDLDLDDNGQADDIDDLPTNETLKYAVQEWASDADHVIIYLIGHNDVYFRLNTSEILVNSDLDQWMDQLQVQTECQITFIYDACKSGNYLSAFSAPEPYSRVVIMSTGEDENAYLIGAISFSNYFWTNIFNGMSVQLAFNLAATVTAQINHPPFMATPQNPLMDADGDGVANETEDYSLTQFLYLGNATDPHENTIQVTTVSTPITLTEGTSAKLTACVVSEKNAVQKVWAVIRRPDYQTGVSETIDIQLSTLNNNQFEGVYHGFETPGTYLIAYYAQDEAGIVCSPEFSTVSVESPMLRRAVLVIGESSDSDLNNFFEQTARSIYDALIFQGYTDDTLYMMGSTVFSEGWDSNVTLSNIHYAMGDWTKTTDGDNATQDFVICFIGLTQKNQFIVNSRENFSNELLNTYIEQLENQIPGKILVVCDAPNAWGFLSKSAQKESDRRILIASSSTEESVAFVTENNISFSDFFWQRVFNGFDVKESFCSAKDALMILSQFQAPSLDADGDGNVNQYNDYAEAHEFTIGYGIMLAQDAVSISDVMDTNILNGETKTTIWASDIVSTSTIDKVWAVIIPPEFNDPFSSVLDHLPQIELIYNDQTNRYEADYSSFTVFGEYNIAIYASSSNGMTSDPASTIVYQTNAPDPFENFDDNASEHPQIININNTEAQRHNFHIADDHDWIKFYAITGKIYRIFTSNADINCDPVIELYDKDGLTQLMLSNDGVGDEREEIVWSCPSDGVYFVKVRNYSSEVYGVDTGYDLRINLVATIFDGKIIGYVKTYNTNVPINNALIRTDKDLTDISLSTGTYRIGGHESGNTVIFAEASGFIPYSASIFVDSISTTRHDIFMISAMIAGDLNADRIISIEDAIIAAQLFTNIDINFEEHMFAADLTGNGRVGIEEIIYILTNCAGINF